MNWDQLPGREALNVATETHPAFFEGKRVIVTGAAGCIGGALANALSLANPAQLVLIDMSEQGIYELQRHFHSTIKESRVVTILGDICDATMLGDLFGKYRPEIVFHAAAFKHVPLLEENPFAAIANNSLGTETVAQLAADHGCEQFILVSTDKAADPTSVMGASKRIAEMVLLAMKKTGTRMSAVRLGNVLNSPGSIVPLFAEQIASGGPITITHADVQRYFITVEEATNALLEAASTLYESAILVPKMGEPLRVLEMATYMFSTLHPGVHNTPRVDYIGLRPGDKLKEVLIATGEAWRADPRNEKGGQQLRGIDSVCPPAASMNAAIRELAHSVRERNLPRLIRTIQGLVPLYQPSSVILGLLDSTRQPQPEVTL